VLRYHLALIIPQPASSCGIKVNGETRHWEEGKSLVFDDTYRHEAWNDTNGDRVVLFMDFVRPLRFPASLLNWVLLNAIALSPLVLGAKGNYLAWEKRKSAQREPSKINDRICPIPRLRDETRIFRIVSEIILILSRNS
ncbi:MAG: hypothetical protein DMF35_09075, partial [Verrucomicrobia bacterium]